LFSAALGAFFGLALLKFGNPPIMEHLVTAPTNAYELVFGSPWPITWAYGLLAIVVLLGLPAFRRNSAAPLWLVLLPLAWWLWQLVASTRSVDPRLSVPTVFHFLACIATFYLGYFCLSRARQLGWFWAGLLAGFLGMLAFGWQQHFGGLEQTRQYFFTYIYPQLKEVQPEYLKKMTSTRIFATLFYPNALAGAIVLLLPPLLGVLWQARDRFTTGARAFLVGSVAVLASGCLYWSGSKGGWLLFLALGLIALLRLPFGQRLKWMLVLFVMVVGLTGFFVKYAGFFRKGATSVSARFDYWQAAARTFSEQPFFGTGPGTFSVPYARIKRPESEMSRLVHNDYLEQASDSGLPGFLGYAGLMVGGLFYAWRRWWRASESHLGFWIWLGVLGWAAQGLMEFGLYIPATAWPAFGLLGLLLGSLPACQPPAASAPGATSNTKSVSTAR
jgi:O-antigen ligase